MKASLGPVVVGQVQVSDLCGDDGLRGRGQRRVTDRAGLVVGEVPRLLLGAEGVPTQVHGLDQVGLLDDLFAVELEVRVVQQQRVMLRRGSGEVPLAVLGEVLRLGVNTELVRRTAALLPSAAARQVVDLVCG